MMKTTIASIGLALCLALASLAAAAEIDRATYKASVEPICKKNAKANDRILRPIRKLVKKNKLKPAARRFFKASKALKKTYRQLKTVPQPTTDESRLSRWLHFVGVEGNLFAKVGKKLKHGQKGPAQHLVFKLTKNANKANALVIAFGFHYCKFEPGKYT